jgi:hypothetical protein
MRPSRIEPIVVPIAHIKRPPCRPECQLPILRSFSFAGLIPPLILPFALPHDRSLIMFSSTFRSFALVALGLLPAVRSATFEVVVGGPGRLTYNPESVVCSIPSESTLFSLNLLS